MTISQYKKKIWNKVSKYIRTRDSKDGYARCITCGIRKLISELHAGHFIHGSTKKSYFDEKNIHAQCRSCNFYKDGARDVYALKLVEKYGDGIIQELHAVNRDGSVWTMDELKIVEQKYDTLTQTL